jgi:hypothetical protein
MASYEADIEAISAMDASLLTAFDDAPANLSTDPVDIIVKYAAVNDALNSIKRDNGDNTVTSDFVRNSFNDSDQPELASQRAFLLTQYKTIASNLVQADRSAAGINAAEAQLDVYKAQANQIYSGMNLAERLTLAKAVQTASQHELLNTDHKDLVAQGQYRPNPNNDLSMSDPSRSGRPAPQRIEGEEGFLMEPNRTYFVSRERDGEAKARFNKMLISESADDIVTISRMRVDQQAVNFPQSTHTILYDEQNNPGDYVFTAYDKNHEVVAKVQFNNAFVDQKWAQSFKNNNKGFSTGRIVNEGERQGRAILNGRQDIGKGLANVGITAAAEGIFSIFGNSSKNRNINTNDNMASPQAITSKIGIRGGTEGGKVIITSRENYEQMLEVQRQAEIDAQKELERQQQQKAQDGKSGGPNKGAVFLNTPNPIDPQSPLGLSNQANEAVATLQKSGIQIEGAPKINVSGKVAGDIDQQLSGVEFDFKTLAANLINAKDIERSASAGIAAEAANSMILS